MIKIGNRICKIILTENERDKLYMFLSMTTTYRENELKAWQELSQEKKEDGSLQYPKAPSNANWWNDLCNAVTNIKDAIKHCEYIEEKSLETNEENEIDICE